MTPEQYRQRAALLRKRNLASWAAELHEVAGKLQEK
jgi:hypothetical protein